TDLDPRLLALELQVLRIAAKHRADTDRDVGAEPNVSLEHGACLDRAAVAQRATVPHDRVRTDRDIVAELGSRRNDSGRMNPWHHRGFAHRSRTMAAISASAT